MRYRLTHSAQTSRAQVMTPPRLARRVVEFLSGSDDAWLELGSGTGNIAQQCLDLRSPRGYVGVELDKQLLREVPLDSRAQFLEGDVLSPRVLSNLLGDRKFSRTIGNPPYGMLAMSREAKKRVADLCPGIGPAVREAQPRAR